MNHIIEKLAGDIRYLESAHDPATRLQAAQTLLASARESCSAPVDLPVLTDAGSALLVAVKAAVEEGTFSADLAAVGHDFADLARLKPVRRAAYPAEADQPGGRWLDVVMQLIDRTDFTVGRMFRQRVSQFPDKTVIVVPRAESVEEF
ncbi:MAG: hypothetical protein KJ749_03865, partial [Planctomycetes bacterium]|nr:hypothetical protein [Planctomycetota bacterium]